MPMYVLNRNFTLATTNGHRIVFHKGVSTFVPPPVEAAAIAVGATRADGSEPDIGADDVVVKPADMTQEQRQAKIVDAIKVIVARNLRDDFNAGGQPKEAALSKQAGFEIKAAERNEVFQIYHELELA